MDNRESKRELHARMLADQERAIAQPRPAIGGSYKVDGDKLTQTRKPGELAKPIGSTAAPIKAAPKGKAKGDNA